MSNPFGCPDKIYHAMTGAHAPEMLKAVMWLGPQRITWSPTNIPASASYKQYVNWRFIKKSGPALMSEIFDAAAKIGFTGKEAA